MKIAICSGKGGTGKTTVSLSLAWALGQSEYFRKPVCLLDCDVEEPNCHLFLHCDYDDPETVSADKPEFIADKCIGCGRCANKCRYNAIAMVKGTPLVFNDMCHSCGVCAAVCPHQAIKMQQLPIGEILRATENRYFRFAYGRLKIGESQSPMVITRLIKSAPDSALVILDGPPGTACSAVKTIGTADRVILVTEPTPFGAHDLSLALNLCNELEKPAGIVINRSDENDTIIEKLAEHHAVPIIGRIPYSREYARTCCEGKILSAEFPTLRPLFIDCYTRFIDTAKVPVRFNPDLTSNLEYGQSPATVEQKQGNYQEITILSGKGGTGKTTVTGAFAALAESRVFADCDVDAANLSLLLRGRNLYRSSISLGSQATINPLKCTKCGKCYEECRFEAIQVDPHNGGYRVHESHCEGCGLCIEICPAKAISEKRCETGKLMMSEGLGSTLIHADLNTAAENSGKLVSMVRDLAFAVVEQQNKEWLICDGPPGTACPAIAAVTGSDRVILITEPSVAALHDLERVIKLVRHFGLIPEIIINKADINAPGTRRIHDLATAGGYKVIGEIPFDDAVKQSIKAGIPIVEYDRNSPASQSLVNIWKKIKETRNENRDSRN